MSQYTDTPIDAATNSLRPADANGGSGASYSAFRSRSIFGSLDGLRALSIIAVVWHHVPGENWLMRNLPGARFGFLGVDLFFVISGFLIVTLLLRERADTGGISLKKFYVRRSLRIFPLYYGLILVFALFYFFRDDARAIAFRADLPYLLTYLTNWHHAAGMFAITWSLAAEEQFYMLWPAIERFLARFAVPILAGLMAVSQIIHLGAIDGFLLAWFGWTPDQPAMLRETTFMPILLGVALAHALHYRGTSEWLMRVLGGRSAAPIALALLFFVAQFLPDDIRGWPRLTMHLLMVILVATVVVREDHALARLLRFGPVARIGVVSYGIYLLHHIGLSGGEAIGAALGTQLPHQTFLFGGLLAWALAELSFRYYEKPFLGLKRRFASGGAAKHSSPERTAPGEEAHAP
jgi:peptidoglycan/LPS O-acetylase OafA/YrhL